MNGFNTKRNKICAITALICCFIFIIVFYVSDILTGDKEFSQYTQLDWFIAVPSLILMFASAIASFTCSFIVIIPVIIHYPALIDYVNNKKFSDIQEDIGFIIFDHNELKRACCRHEDENGIWFSVKEYYLKKKNWVILEEGRYVKNHTELIQVLQNDYQFDKIKYNYTKN